MEPFNENTDGFHDLTLFVFVVFVEAGLTNITLTWDARLAASTRLEFKVEHGMFVRTGGCRGNLGRRVIRHLPLLPIYNVTVHRVIYSGQILKRDVVLSGRIRMANIRESSIWCGFYSIDRQDHMFSP